MHAPTDQTARATYASNHLVFVHLINPRIPNFTPSASRFSGYLTSMLFIRKHARICVCCKTLVLFQVILRTICESIWRWEHHLQRIKGPRGCASFFTSPARLHHTRPLYLYPCAPTLLPLSFIPPVIHYGSFLRCSPGIRRLRWHRRCLSHPNHPHREARRERTCMFLHSLITLTAC